VEKTIPKTFIKKDLFGCIDILGISQDGSIIAVQTTSDNTGGNSSSRLKKCRESEVLPSWKAGGHLFEVHAWAKRGAQGKRKLWQVVVTEL